MLLNKNLPTITNHAISVVDISVEKTLENQVKSFHKKSNNHLHIVWLTDKNGSLTGHWTTQD